MKIDPAAHQLQLLQSMCSINKLVLREQDLALTLCIWLPCACGSNSLSQMW